MSIQALILVPEPYFNEPGFEGSLGTKQGNAASQQYNASIRRHTLKTAIHDQLKNRKSVFRDVILRHCLRKRGKLLAQCERWEKEAKALEASFKDKDKHKLSLNSESLHDLALFGQVLPPSLPPALFPRLAIMAPTQLRACRALARWRKAHTHTLAKALTRAASLRLTAALRFGPTQSPSPPARILSPLLSRSLAL